MIFSIIGRTYCFNTSSFPQIQEIYLFGSVARGDYDEFSDIDFLFIVTDCTQAEYNELKGSIAEELGVPAKWISLYELSKINAMFDEGSLFLWHIKLEGIKLFSRDGYLEEILLSLPMYSKAQQSLEDYKTILQDITDSLMYDVVILDFEFALLASLVRNACIIFDYNNGVFAFGRFSAVQECNRILGKEFIPLSEYQWLYEHRSSHNSYSNEYLESADDISKMEFWLNKVNVLLKIAERSSNHDH
jgi:Predicted nucleotidyltransferases